jgi:hypothetical protein
VGGGVGGRRRLKPFFGRRRAGQRPAGGQGLIRNVDEITASASGQSRRAS